MAIRYDKKITNEINKTIRNFNQKIKRLEKQERDLILPNKITKKELISDVSNRNELKRRLNELKRYSKRGIEETKALKSGAKISLYEYENLKREITRQKRLLTRQIKVLGETIPTVFGKKQVATLRQMGSMRVANLEARRKSLEKKIEELDISDIRTLEDRLKQNRLKYQYRNIVFEDSFNNKILFNLAYWTKYDKNKIKSISEKLNTLTPSQFKRLIDTEESLRRILEYYPNDFTESPEANKKEINSLYDELYNNIDDIIKDYKK